MYTPSTPPAPIRIGGAVGQPALIARVGPVYPPLAVQAQVEGVVVLEAVVDREGRVEDVRVLRSIPLLDRAAMDAVRQWRYAPLLVNGTPVSFILTVDGQLRPVAPTIGGFAGRLTTRDQADFVDRRTSTLSWMESGPLRSLQ